ncbi:MAG: ester cyclase [Bacteroidota bacterium]|nr:ester cyclase [Bacteroidota bacterium]
MKKTILVLAVTTLTFTACNNAKTDNNATEKSGTASASGEEQKEEQNKKTALASVEAFGSHNIDDVFKDVTPDAIDYGDGSMTPVKGLDSSKAMAKMWMDAFPDVKGSNLKTVADGDWVVVWGDWSGTWKKDFMGQKATGRSYKVKDADIFKFNDAGKITEHHAIQSSNEIARQVGMKMSKQ